MPILTPEERIGTNVGGKYRLESIIGKGGMGVVYAAVHEWTGRPVAVKLLLMGFDDSPEVSGRFLQEARAAARIDHPNVVDVLDMGKDDDGTPFMVLERLSGETLQDLLRRERRLDPQLCMDIMLPVMDALGEAHSAGIVHRDIKPSNIFLAETRNGRVSKLLDFGIAKVHGEDAAWKTQTGGLLGTPCYMSPEQVRATSTVGPAADVWAIGVVLYQCLSGELPFHNINPGTILSLILTTRPPDLDDVAPDVPFKIAQVVNVALLEDPIERHADMAEFAEALRNAAQASGTQVTGRVQGRGLRESATLRVAGPGGYVAATPAAVAPASDLHLETTVAPVRQQDVAQIATASASIAYAATERAAVRDDQSALEESPRFQTPLTAPHFAETNADAGDGPGGTTPFATQTPSRSSASEPHKRSPILLSLGGISVAAAVVLAWFVGAGSVPTGESDSSARQPQLHASSPSSMAAPEYAAPPSSEAGEAASVPSGMLSIRSSVACAATLDGRPVDGPRDNMFVAAGTHELTCEHDGEVQRIEVVVVPERETVHTFRFAAARRPSTSQHARMSPPAAMEPTPTMTEAPLDIGRDYQ